MKRVSFALLALLCLSMPGVSAQAREISGKVLAVFHESVSVNNRWLDKISVTINSCNPAGQWETVSYSPGVLSNENSLGFLYGEMAGAAHSVVMKTPYLNSVSGYVTLAVNDQNVVQKTTFWGYNWECGRNVDIAPPQMPQMPGGFPGMSPQPGSYPGGMPNSGFSGQNQNPSPNAYPSAPSSVNPIDLMRRLGF